MEAEPGIEPGYTDLQSAASPLCHPASTSFNALSFERSVILANYEMQIKHLFIAENKKGLIKSALLRNLLEIPESGAGKEVRTPDPNLGKVVLYR